MADTVYPGEAATPAQIQALADEYRVASLALRKLGRRGEPLSYAPFRLTAIHAVELYLNAFLLKRDHTPCYLRSFQHDLAARAQLALDSGLNLRNGTAEHLRSLTTEREYLVARYAPELVEAMSEITRMEATLKDVATKVGKASAISPAVASR